MNSIFFKYMWFVRFFFSVFVEFFFETMEFVTMGERFGLKRNDLQDFVEKKEREQFERMERVAEREARKIESEIELEKIKRETELHRVKSGELASSSNSCFAIAC